MKGMGRESEPWPVLGRKGNHILTKLVVSVLLIGISFRLLFSRPQLTPVFRGPLEDTSSLDKADFSDSLAPKTAVDNEDRAQKDTVSVDKADFSDSMSPEVAIDFEGQHKDKCDIFTGKWIPNPAGPAYTNETCRFIESPQNCMTNGRTDTGYLYWRWKPHDCDVHPFDAHTFLNGMRNRSWALIGDSILRNHVQSLICLLSKAEVAVDVYHDEGYKSRIWRFPSHNFTLSLVWAPFLAKAAIFENDDGESSSEIQLHLDTLDETWTSQYHNFDYVVISGGQWFLKTAIYMESKKVVGCHYCPRSNFTEFGVENAYRKVVRSVFNFIGKSSHKAFVLYRTWTPDHFENGEWFSGGTCNRTAPFKEGEFGGRDIDHIMRNIELEEFERAVSFPPTNGVQLKLMDTYGLSLQRPDGHPGPYRSFHPFDKGSEVQAQNDCLHWCLPGPIDSWNDLMMHIVFNK